MASGQGTSGTGAGKAGFWIGGLLLVAAFAVAAVGVVVGVRGFSDTVDGYQRVSLARGGTVTFDDTGTQRVFFEAEGAAEDRRFPPPFTIIGPDGGTVVVRSESTEETYELSGREGRKLGKIDVVAPGPHEVRVTITDGSGGTDLGDLAFGEEGPTRSVIPILVGVLGGGALALLGAIVLIVTGVRRGRRRRAAVGPMGPPPGNWGAPPGPAGWSPAAPPPPGPSGLPTWSPGSPPPPPPDSRPLPPAAPAPTSPSANPPSSSPPPSSAPPSAPSSPPSGPSSSPPSWTPAPWTPPNWTPPSGPASTPPSDPPESPIS